MDFLVLVAIGVIVFLLVVIIPGYHDIKERRQTIEDDKEFLAVLHAARRMMTLSEVCDRIDWKWSTSRMFQTARRLEKRGIVKQVQQGALQYYLPTGKAL